MKVKQNKTRYSRIAVLLLMCLPVGIMAQEQKKDTIQRKENIKAAEYMIPRRRGADRFESKKGTEHLFFSAGAG